MNLCKKKNKGVRKKVEPNGRKASKAFIILQQYYVREAFIHRQAPQKTQSGKF